MLLPNRDRAVVPADTVTNYLLSRTHRTGRSKALFFLRFGFHPESWEVLTAALLRHAMDCDVAKTEGSPFGTRYVVERPLQSPDGRNPWVRSVWFIETGAEVPRLVTA